MTVTNFSFLQKEFPMLYNIAASAEYYLYADPVASLFKLRQFGEKLTAYVCDTHQVDIPSDDTFNNRIRVLESENIFPANIASLINNIKLGETRLRISRKNLGLLELPCPPLPEQKRIVAHRLENEQRLLKEDLIELSNIKYGLFSIDEWKQILACIITKKIEEFDLKGENKAKMRAEISAFLYKAIGEFEERYHEKQNRTFFGFIEGTAARAFGVFDKIKADIPTFTENILDFMNDPQNRKAIRGYILKKLNDYTDKTFGKIDYTAHNEIIARHHFQDRQEALERLAAQIDSIENNNQPYKASLLTIAFIAGLYLIFKKRFSKSEYAIFTVICTILLLSGLLLPMIEIDARIATMNFTLLGESVAFNDQVLYYKSKSILEVVQLMIIQSKVDLLLVGLLVFVFSVLFPLSKLASSIVYIYSRRFRSNKIIRFLLFKTGKWSMADVMVIAIFMAYIGFTGIITEQLKQIENITPTLDLLTTNNSNLGTGFFLFTAFAILSLLVSHKLQYEFKRPTMTEERREELEEFLR